MYKLQINGNGEIKSVFRFDGWSIPFDPANADYQQYLKWLEEGNEPLPYVPPTPVDHLTDLQEAKELSATLIRTTAYSKLQPTDWYVVRFTETQTEIPENITIFRETIRTESSSKIATVESKESLEDLKDYLRSEEYATWTELQ
jgi:hypothetical protein